MRTFAGGIDWPGWCRSGRDEETALEALVAYGSRYASAIAPTSRRFRLPKETSALQVVERVKGNATTDFGAPGIPPPSDGRSVDPKELKRLTDLLKACWAEFDRAAETAASVVLRKGPRGGGRELSGIVSHVIEADRAYLSKLGGKRHRVEGADVGDEMAGIRQSILDALVARVQGEPIPKGRRSKPWPPRYAVRRSAWHALDHAWEIEDRS